MKATVVLLFLVGQFLFMSGDVGALVADDAMAVDQDLIDAQRRFTDLGPEIDFLQTSEARVIIRPFFLAKRLDALQRPVEALNVAAVSFLLQKQGI